MDEKDIRSQIENGSIIQTMEQLFKHLMTSNIDLMDFFHGRVRKTENHITMIYILIVVISLPNIIRFFQ